MFNGYVSLPEGTSTSIKYINVLSRWSWRCSHQGPACTAARPAMCWLPLKLLEIPPGDLKHSWLEATDHRNQWLSYSKPHSVWGLSSHGADDTRGYPPVILDGTFPWLGHGDVPQTASQSQCQSDLVWNHESSLLYLYVYPENFLHACISMYICVYVYIHIYIYIYI